MKLFNTFGNVILLNHCLFQSSQFIYLLEYCTYSLQYEEFHVKQKKSDSICYCQVSE